MRVKNRVILGIASLLLLVGAIVIFSPFNRYVKGTATGKMKVKPEKLSFVNVNEASIKELEK